MQKQKIYPNLIINVNDIYENTREVVKRAGALDVDITAVTKCTGGRPEVAQAYIDGGAKAIGDSRIKNLKRLKDLDTEKWLLRIPMISEAEDVVLYSDLSLNSEYAVIKSLDEQARKHGLVHDIILMIDLGDLREGWFDLEDFKEDLEKISELKNIRIRGIGTNSNCAGAVIPEPSTFKPFKAVVEVLEKDYDIKDPIVSGGNSGAYYMLEDKTLPGIINNLRLGEVLLFGREASYLKQYDYLNHNAFMLQGEVIEVKEKPSVPIGKHGKDAFENEPVFEDLGIRKRALLAVGKQDVPPEHLFPLDKGTRVVTASGDHLIIDVTDSEIPYKVGDIVTFRCNYVSAMRASTSGYMNITID